MVLTDCGSVLVEANFGPEEVPTAAPTDGVLETADVVGSAALGLIVGDDEIGAYGSPVPQNELKGGQPEEEPCQNGGGECEGRMDEVVEEEDESVEERMDPGRVESEEVGAGDNAPACSNPPNMCADPRELVDVSWTNTALVVLPSPS